MFINTRILGVKIPFHINFEEVNLRFYVKRFEKGEWKRGVVFIKEIVPKAALTFVANTVYKEHYETLPMKHHWNENNEFRTVDYQWKKNDTWNSFYVKADLTPKTIEENSETEFITEHYWGYAQTGVNTTNEYEVIHPKWEHYPVLETEINVNYGEVYGKEFEFLNNLKPTSVMLAEGSEITVEGRRKIKG